MNQPLRKYRLASARSPGSAPRAQRQAVGTCDLAPLPPRRLQEIQARSRRHCRQFLPQPLPVIAIFGCRRPFEARK